MIVNELYYDYMSELSYINNALFESLFIIEASYNMVPYKKYDQYSKAWQDGKDKNKASATIKDADPEKKSKLKSLKEKVKAAIQKIIDTILEMVKKVKEFFSRLAFKLKKIAKKVSYKMNFIKYCFEFINSYGELKVLKYQGKGIKIKEKDFQNLVTNNPIKYAAECTGILKLEDDIEKATSVKELEEKFKGKDILLEKLNNIYNIKASNLNEVDSLVIDKLFKSKDIHEISGNIKQFGLDVVPINNLYADQKFIREHIGMLGIAETAEDSIKELSETALWIYKKKIDNLEDQEEISLMSNKARYVYSLYYSAAQHLMVALKASRLAYDEMLNEIKRFASVINKYSEEVDKYNKKHSMTYYLDKKMEEFKKKQQEFYKKYANM